MEDVFLKLKASSSVVIRYFNSYLEKKKGETCKKTWILEVTVVYNNRRKPGLMVCVSTSQILS